MTKIPGPKFELWLDLETTGSEDFDEIIEVGCIMTDRQHNELGRRSWLVMPKRPDWLAMLKPVVRDMHTVNGLIKELKVSKFSGAAQSCGVEQVEIEMLDWFKTFLPEDEPLRKFRACLGGSGVAHFDKRFLDKYMPDVARRLTYWSLDVGPVRRMCRVAAPNLMPAFKSEDKTHRALEDAEMHLNEWRHYEKLLVLLQEFSTTSDEYLYTVASSLDDVVKSGKVGR